MDRILSPIGTEEARILRFGPEAGPDASVQVPSAERVEPDVDETGKAEAPPATDEDVSQATKTEINVLKQDLDNVETRITKGIEKVDELQQGANPVPQQQKKAIDLIEYKREEQKKNDVRENYESASRILMFLQDSGFMQKSMHSNNIRSLNHAMDKQAEKAAWKAEGEKLMDPTNTESEIEILFGTVEPTRDRVKDQISSDHGSILDYSAYSQEMEEYQAALSTIQRDPARNTLVLDQATVNLFGLEGDVVAEGEKFVPKDPKALMTEIKTRMESFRQGGKILFTKEKMMIEDTEHDHIPKEIEKILDSAQLTENGEWKIENGEAALEFIQNYAEPIEGDDFLETEERSWCIPMQEYHRKEEDGANIEAEQKIQAFKVKAEENGADWAKIEPLLRECTAYRKPENREDEALKKLKDPEYRTPTEKAYEQQREIFRLLYAKIAPKSSEKEQPEYAGMKRAYEMIDAVKGVSEPPVSPLDSPEFLQQWNKATQKNDKPKKELLQVQIDAFNKEFGEYTTNIETLRKTYPELPIAMNAGISAAIDTTPLLSIATSVLDREISAFVKKEQPNMEHAVDDIDIKRDTQKYNEQEFREERDRPTRRDQLLGDIQKKEVPKDGSLTLNNKEMNRFRSLVLRRATQTKRVYGNRIHEVTPTGDTKLSPTLLAKADPSRILIPYRNPVFTQRFKQWETDHMQRDPEVVQDRQQRFQTLDSLNTLRDEFRSHLLDSHNAKLPENVEEQLKTFAQLISDNNTLNLSAVVLTPEQVKQFDERLKEAHDILSTLNEENEPKGERHNAAKLKKTFDRITDDDFVTLGELEKDLKALPPDSEEAKTLRMLLEAGKVAKDTHTPTQVKGINLTFNRHGEIGIHESNAKALLEKVHTDHLDIWSMDDVDMQAIAQARCPITVHDGHLTPSEAQAFRSYIGRNAVLILPDITELSPQTIYYLSNNHCKLVMTVTLMEELSDESIMALREINKLRENDVTLVIPKEATISKLTLERYESLGRYRIKVKNLGATVTDGSEAKNETVTEEKADTSLQP